jgi:hypothetical protein
VDHTVIDTGHHRLLIGTIRITSANDCYLAVPVSSARPTSVRNRRISLVAGRPGEGPLTEPIAAAQPRRQEPLFMPHYGPCLELVAEPRCGGERSFASRH